MRGANRIDFLHRMSTGDLLGIQPGEGRTTVFTTPIGRMLDYAVALAFDDSLLLLSGGNDQSRLVRWLRKYIFFNDDVQLTDESPATAMLGIFGANAGDLAEGLHAGASQMTRYAHRSVGSGALVKAAPLQGDGYYLINPPQAAEGLRAFAPVSDYEDLRIRAGYPGFPNEISEDRIPLEAGLLGAVSFSKGCYIGQEIIARMESRGQLARRLVMIQSDAAMQVGEEVKVNGNAVGLITSATSDGRAALAYLRSAVALVGQELLVGENAARVAGLARL
ncbi:MAG: glycine cleavage system protein T [Chloroflexi bacterium]|nr:glycine cleavage system protein T [Chloroflexota bacterium]MCL5274200.1 glycine cleavage system protein T [Chloroflexota bacterium]